jgi:hypothetical protein
MHSDVGFRRFFLNGRHIGGADALEAELLGLTGPPESRPT